MINNLQNTFLISVAILLVVVTLYFTTNALKRNYEINQLKLDEENRQREEEKVQLILVRQQLEAKEAQRQNNILARLREHQHLCYDMEIFTAQVAVDKILDSAEAAADQSNQVTNLRQSKVYHKKDLSRTQLTKKNPTTEPIIYLFVLVLLYLLLRAASDITQHYKEQSKGDKRNNRRCSLQVYAQMKNDRRSSRGTIYDKIKKYLKH